MKTYYIDVFQQGCPDLPRFSEVAFSYSEFLDAYKKMEERVRCLTTRFNGKYLTKTIEIEKE